MTRYFVVIDYEFHRRITHTPQEYRNLDASYRIQNLKEKYFHLNFAHCEFFIIEKFGSSITHTASQTFTTQKIRIAPKFERKIHLE